MAVITGNALNNTLNGTANPDIISGLGGNDSLAGGRGADFLSGGPGIDLYTGGQGNDIFFIDPGDRPINGGAGQDVAILALGGDTFGFGRTTFVGMEGIQDVPGARVSNVSMGAGAFSTTNGNTFRFAMGDGQDSVTLLDDGRLRVVDGNLVYDNRVAIEFEGVERLTVVNQTGGTSVLTSQVTPAGTLEAGFAGPGSVAAKAAAAFALAADPALDRGDLRPIANLLNEIRAGGNDAAVTGGDIRQTAEIIQKALGQGNVNQIADILQNATDAGGDVNQQAAIDQVAKATGGNVNQVASIVQKATDFALPNQEPDNGNAFGGGNQGGDVSQSASIEQNASTSGGGSVSQEASINQSANNGANDGFFMT